MGWFRVDDSFFDHPKTEGLTLAQVGLWLRFGVWCAAHPEREGFVPYRVAADICRTSRMRVVRQVSALVANNLLVYDPDMDGWWMHNYHDYNPTWEQVKTRRDQDKRRQQRARERSMSRRDTDTGQFGMSRRDEGVASRRTPTPTPTTTSYMQPIGGAHPQAVDNSGSLGGAPPMPKPRPKPTPAGDPRTGTGTSKASRIPDPRSTVPRNPALEARTRRRIDGTTCPICHDVGMVDDPDIGAYPCPEDHP